MEHRHSLVPLDHFTTGLSDAQLRGLVERHSVTFEVSPNQVPAPSGGVVRHGWLLDLYGEWSAADNALEGRDAAQHVHDVLHAVTRAAFPGASGGPVLLAVEPYAGAIHFDPRRGFASEVRLRMVVERASTARMSLAPNADTETVAELTERLAALGCRRRS